MIVKLLTEQQLEFLSLKGSCTGSSASTLVKMPHCWKSHVAAHFTLKNLVIWTFARHWSNTVVCIIYIYGSVIIFNLNLT